MAQYLFIYGTLLKEFDNSVAKFLSAHSELVGNAYFHGLLFEIDNYPGAIYIPDIEHKVHGHLLKISHFDPVIQSLDDYEEIGRKFPEPHEYVRKLVRVIHQKCLFEAWTYLYNYGLNNKSWIASGHYPSYKRLL